MIKLRRPDTGNPPARGSNWRCPFAAKASVPSLYPWVSYHKKTVYRLLLRWCVFPWRRVWQHSFKTWSRGLD